MNEISVLKIQIYCFYFEIFANYQFIIGFFHLDVVRTSLAGRYSFIYMNKKKFLER